MLQVYQNEILLRKWFGVVLRSLFCAVALCDETCQPTF